MPKVKTFSKGGILIDSHRSLTGTEPLRPLFLPSLAVVPLAQYAGARAQWIVSLGDSVTEDQILARGVRAKDLPVHSPIPGTVLEFREITLPGGVVSSAAVIQLQGEFRRTGRPSAKKEWALDSPLEILNQIRSAGVLLENSPMDSPRDFDSLSQSVDFLVINALQPEPYLTLSSHLLAERSSELLEGVRILQKLCNPQSTHLAYDPEFPDSWLAEIGDRFEDLVLHCLEFKYPQAQEGLLVQTLGLRTLTNKSPKVLCLDVPSILAIRDAVVEGKPQVERTVVVSGKGVKRPGAYVVRIGTPLIQLLKDAGGVEPGDHKILVGGPFHGHKVDHLASPVMKSTSAVLVLDKDEVNSAAQRECIRCGECVLSCPVGLEPLNLHKLLLLGDTKQARQEGLDFCIECGICSYICPSRIPLVTEFHGAKETQTDV